MTACVAVAVYIKIYNIYIAWAHPKFYGIMVVSCDFTVYLLVSKTLIHRACPNATFDGPGPGW